MSEGNPKKERFKHTRELVRIALQELTQSEIAKLCRTSQGTVSEWGSGKSKAQLHVIRPLLHRYGNRLNRTTARVYLVEAPAAEAPRWEESAIGRRLIALRDRLASHDVADKEVNAERNALAELIFGSAADLPHPLENPETMIRVHREELAARGHPPKIVRVDGPIVLRHTFRKLLVVPHGPRVELEPRSRRPLVRAPPATRAVRARPPASPRADGTRLAPLEMDPAGGHRER
jgi:transcriptional regulator with XRE-family HTH domain